MATDSAPHGRPLQCESCGIWVAATIGNRCMECNEEDADLAALQQAVDRMVDRIEERRAQRRETDVA